MSMSSNIANLPPYSEKLSSTPSASASRIAGLVQTCSIRDFQVDYFNIICDSATSYHISLTVEDTPLYRIELVSDSTKIGNIQIFQASNITLPAVAAARLSANLKSKSEPPAMICTSSPHLSDAHWRPLIRTGMIFKEFQSLTPIVTVPGRPAIPHSFHWRTWGVAEPFYQLWWEGPLPLVPKSMFVSDQRGSEYVFATMARKTPDGGENLVEIRRGGGLEFELSVFLQLFVILHFHKVQLI